jgi:hypothetical protein
MAGNATQQGGRQVRFDLFSQARLLLFTTRRLWRFRAGLWQSTSEAAAKLAGRRPRTLAAIRRSPALLDSCGTFYA